MIDYKNNYKKIYNAETMALLKTLKGLEEGEERDKLREEIIFGNMWQVTFRAQMFKQYWPDIRLEDFISDGIFVLIKLIERWKVEYTSWAIILSRELKSQMSKMTVHDHYSFIKFPRDMPLTELSGFLFLDNSPIDEYSGNTYHSLIQSLQKTPDRACMLKEEFLDAVDNEELKPIQKDILKLAYDGWTIKEISEKLNQGIKKIDGLYHTAKYIIRGDPSYHKKILLYRKEYYKNHKDKHQEYQKTYYQKRKYEKENT